MSWNNPYDPNDPSEEKYIKEHSINKEKYTDTERVDYFLSFIKDSHYRPMERNMLDFIISRNLKLNITKENSND